MYGGAEKSFDLELQKQQLRVPAKLMHLQQLQLPLVDLTGVAPFTVLVEDGPAPLFHKRLGHPPVGRCLIRQLVQEQDHLASGQRRAHAGRSRSLPKVTTGCW